MNVCMKERGEKVCVCERESVSERKGVRKREGEKCVLAKEVVIE